MDVMTVFSNTRGSNFEYVVSRQKEQLRAARRVDSINEYCSELSEEQRQALIAFCDKWGGRLPIHIYRMLGNGRSEVEKSFAFNFIKNVDEIWAENLEADKEVLKSISEDELLDLNNERLERTFSSESDDSGMFWTFAPYVYKNLPDKSEKDRIRKIFNWALLKDTPKNKLDEETESQQIHLKDLKRV